MDSQANDATTAENAESAEAWRSVLESRGEDSPCILGRAFYRQYRSLSLRQWDDGQQGTMYDEITGALIDDDLEMADPAGCWISEQSICYALLSQIKRTLEQLKTKRRKVNHSTDAAAPAQVAAAAAVPSACASEAAEVSAAVRDAVAGLSAAAT